ncbi:response regulator transcription factor [Plebeiibacterium marinum]|uniref:Response regulator transcription factor n=1 Tax=Plebeiibacterium marinum TaxID=2992111 RepID=A0AAE3MHM9_9BACT|nr:response regulator transcription factor [Plebeiobacterium marinum]MCW3807801.1 response regulator transcription factor [Plebeiobacterium marinum]
MGKAKIVIADDHVLFRDGLKTIIELSDVGDVVGDVSNGAEMIEIILGEKPDLVIIDIDMPVMNGIEATQKALEIYPDLNILALTMFSNQKYYFDMVNAGAKGFVLKTSGKLELMDAISTVLKGGNYISSQLMPDIIKSMHSLNESLQSPSEPMFNSRDIEILNLMLIGLTAKEISDKLNLSTKTVANYKTNMLEKTGCKNAISLIVYALKSNVISL